MLISYLNALQAALTYAENTGSWVVVVVVGRLFQSLSGLLAALRPEGSNMAGSTLLLPKGGKVSVVKGEHRVQGTGYVVMFLGFDDTLEASEEIALHAWRARSEGLVFYNGALSEFKAV